MNVLFLRKRSSCVVSVLTECPIGKAGGMAYEVVLKPAVVVTPKRPMSPPKDRVISKDEIMHKLKDAEERRLVSVRDGDGRKDAEERRLVSEGWRW